LCALNVYINIFKIDAWDREGRRERKAWKNCIPMEPAESVLPTDRPTQYSDVISLSNMITIMFFHMSSPYWYCIFQADSYALNIGYKITCQFDRSPLVAYKLYGNRSHFILIASLFLSWCMVNGNSCCVCVLLIKQATVH